MPVLLPFEVRDEDGDGLIDLAVAADNDCRNPYSLLNVLWVFKGQPKLDLDELRQGRSGVPPSGDVAGGDDPTRQLLSPSVNVVLVRFAQCGKGRRETAPEFIVESPDAAKPGRQNVSFGSWTVTGTEPFAEVKSEKDKSASLRARKLPRARIAWWP